MTLLYKKESLWNQSQRIRAEILFKEYPDIKKGYYLSMRLGGGKPEMVQGSLAGREEEIRND